MQNTADTTSGTLTSARRRIALRVMLAVVLLAAVVSRLSFLGRPFRMDSGLYLAMGKNRRRRRQALHGPVGHQAPRRRAADGHRSTRCLVATGSATSSRSSPSASRRRSFSRRPRGARDRPRRVVAGGAVRRHAPQLQPLPLHRLSTRNADRLLHRVGGLVRGCAPPLPTAGHGWFLLAGLCAGGAAMAKPTGAAVAGRAVPSSPPSPADATKTTTRTARRPRPAAGSRSAYSSSSSPTSPTSTPPASTARCRASSVRSPAYSAGTSWANALSPRTFAVLAIPALADRRPIFLATAGAMRRGRPMARSRRGRRSPSRWRGAALELVGLVLQKRSYNYYYLPLFVPLTLGFAAVPRPAARVGRWRSGCCRWPALSLYSTRARLLLPEPRPRRRGGLRLRPRPTPRPAMPCGEDPVGPHRHRDRTRARRAAGHGQQLHQRRRRRPPFRRRTSRRPAAPPADLRRHAGHRPARRDDECSSTHLAPGLRDNPARPRELRCRVGPRIDAYVATNYDLEGGNRRPTRAPPARTRSIDAATRPPTVPKTRTMSRQAVASAELHTGQPRLVAGQVQHR